MLDQAVALSDGQTNWVCSPPNCSCHAPLHSWMPDTGWLMLLPLSGPSGF